MSLAMFGPPSHSSVFKMYILDLICTDFGLYVCYYLDVDQWLNSRQMFSLTFSSPGEGREKEETLLFVKDNFLYYSTGLPHYAVGVITFSSSFSSF